MKLPSPAFSTSAQLGCTLLVLSSSFGLASAQRTIDVQPMVWKEPTALHSLTATCQRSGSSMDCTFNQVWISNRTDSPESLKDEEREAFSSRLCEKGAPVAILGFSISHALDIERQAPTIQAAGEDTTLDALGFLNAYRRMLSEEYPSSGYWPPKKRLLGLMAEWIKTCTPPTSEAQKEQFLVTLFAELQRGKCQVFINQYEHSFQQVGEYQWVSNNGPSGLCGVVEVITLEIPDDKPAEGIGWTYKSRSFATQREGPLCKDREDRTMEFKYSIAPFLWPCESIAFASPLLLRR